MDMTYEERCRRQQVIGIVNMVYDIFEPELPTTEAILGAIIMWFECEQTPSKSIKTIKAKIEVDPHNTCAICDAMILRSQTYCSDCDRKLIEGDSNDKGTVVK